ncbi:MAG: SulP family inorganic anion transporter [Bacteroidetes bacterium]|jgi:MFS superfamily sulfate permease-like transporter|nr:SulP family inorganic anion transporter [Bacteroidota bacterium]
MFKTISSDLKAGLVVFLVALPLCLGISVAQGVNPLAGLIAGVIGGIVVAMISGSNLSVSGPAAGLTATVLAALFPEKFGLSIPALSFDAFLVSVMIAGCFQVVLGVIKAGIIGHYIPVAVIKGMLSGIGIILVEKQIPHLFGHDKDPEGDFQFQQSDGENTFTEMFRVVDDISVGATIIGLSCLALLIFWNTGFVKKNRILSMFPGPLVVVVVGVLINLGLNMYAPDVAVQGKHLVDMPDLSTWDKLRSNMVFADFSALGNAHVWSVGIALGLIASIESLLGVEAVDKLDPEFNTTPTNRELIAQGAGNILCGFIGGIPITSVIVRSSANVSAGAKSKLSSITHGLLLLTAIFLIPSVLEMIPLSALAAILILTGWKLFLPTKGTVKTFLASVRLGLTKIGLKIGDTVKDKEVFREGLAQLLPFLVTLIVMYFTDLLKGVAAGLFVGIIFILRQNFKDPFRLLADTIDGQKFYFIRLQQNVTFINKGKFIEFFHSVEPGSKVVIDGGRCSFIDRDVLETITEFKQSSQMKNIEVTLEGITEVEILSKH